MSTTESSLRLPLQSKYIDGSAGTFSQHHQPQQQLATPRTAMSFTPRYTNGAPPSAMMSSRPQTARTFNRRGVIDPNSTLAGERAAHTVALLIPGSQLKVVESVAGKSRGRTRLQDEKNAIIIQSSQQSTIRPQTAPSSRRQAASSPYHSSFQSTTWYKLYSFPSAPQFRFVNLQQAMKLAFPSSSSNSAAAPPQSKHGALTTGAGGSGEKNNNNNTQYHHPICFILNSTGFDRRTVQQQVDDENDDDEEEEDGSDEDVQEEKQEEAEEELIEYTTSTGQTARFKSVKPTNPVRRITKLKKQRCHASSSSTATTTSFTPTPTFTLTYQTHLPSLFSLVDSPQFSSDGGDVCLTLEGMRECVKKEKEKVGLGGGGGKSGTQQHHTDHRLLLYTFSSLFHSLTHIPSYIQSTVQWTLHYLPLTSLPGELGGPMLVFIGTLEDVYVCVAISARMENQQNSQQHQRREIKLTRPITVAQAKGNQPIEIQSTYTSAIMNPHDPSTPLTYTLPLPPPPTGVASHLTSFTSSSTSTTSPPPPPRSWFLSRTSLHIVQLPLDCTFAALKQGVKCLGKLPPTIGECVERVEKMEEEMMLGTQLYHHEKQQQQSAVNHSSPRRHHHQQHHRSPSPPTSLPNSSPPPPPPPPPSASPDTSLLQSALSWIRDDPDESDNAWDHVAEKFESREFVPRGTSAASVRRRPKTASSVAATPSVVQQRIIIHTARPQTAHHALYHQQQQRPLSSNPRRAPTNLHGTSENLIHPSHVTVAASPLIAPSSHGLTYDISYVSEELLSESYFSVMREKARGVVERDEELERRRMMMEQQSQQQQYQPQYYQQPSYQREEKEQIQTPHYITPTVHAQFQSNTIGTPVFLRIGNDALRHEQQQQQHQQEMERERSRSQSASRSRSRSRSASPQKILYPRNLGYDQTHHHHQQHQQVQDLTPTATTKVQSLRPQSAHVTGNVRLQPPYRHQPTVAAAAVQSNLQQSQQVHQQAQDQQPHLPPQQPHSHPLHPQPQSQSQAQSHPPLLLPGQTHLHIVASATDAAVSTLDGSPGSNAEVTPSVNVPWELLKLAEEQQQRGVQEQQERELQQEQQQKQQGESEAQAFQSQTSSKRSSQRSINADEQQQFEQTQDFIVNHHEEEENHYEQQQQQQQVDPEQQQQQQNPDQDLFPSDLTHDSNDIPSHHHHHHHNSILPSHLIDFSELGLGVQSTYDPNVFDQSSSSSSLMRGTRGGGGGGGGSMTVVGDGKNDGGEGGWEDNHSGFSSDAQLPLPHQSHSHPHHSHQPRSATTTASSTSFSVLLHSSGHGGTSSQHDSFLSSPLPSESKIITIQKGHPLSYCYKGWKKEEVEREVNVDLEKMVCSNNSAVGGACNASLTAVSASGCPLFLCTWCQRAVYCSQACLVEDWLALNPSTGGHLSECTEEARECWKEWQEKMRKKKMNDEHQVERGRSRSPHNRYNLKHKQQKQRPRSASIDSHPVAQGDGWMDVINMPSHRNENVASSRQQRRARSASPRRMRDSENDVDGFKREYEQSLQNAVFQAVNFESGNNAAGVNQILSSSVAATIPATVAAAASPLSTSRTSEEHQAQIHRAYLIAANQLKTQAAMFVGVPSSLSTAQQPPISRPFTPQSMPATTPSIQQHQHHRAATTPSVVHHTTFSSATQLYAKTRPRSGTLRPQSAQVRSGTVPIAGVASNAIVSSHHRVKSAAVSIHNHPVAGSASYRHVRPISASSATSQHRTPHPPPAPSTSSLSVIPLVDLKKAIAAARPKSSQKLASNGRTSMPH